jgi:protein TonB
VQLRVYVTPEGLCGELNLLKGSGHDELDEAALEAVKAWKFVPGKLGDTPVASWVTVPIEFHLHDG